MFLFWSDNAYFNFFQNSKRFYNKISLSKNLQVKLILSNFNSRNSQYSNDLLKTRMNNSAIIILICSREL